MNNLYKYYFAPTDGRIYPQALELAELAYKHEILKDGNETCHIVTFTEQQIELMALFYNVARNLLPPEGNYFKTGILSRLEVQRRLEKEGYYNSRNLKKPREFIPKYIEIRKLINKGNFTEAVNKHYASLESKFYGPLHKELIYLKRIGKINLSGRDLLFYKKDSNQSDLVKSNIYEYCTCLNNVIEERRETGTQLPLDILIENAPTIEDSYKKVPVISLISLENKEIEEMDFFSVYYPSFSRAVFGYYLEGRLFDRYLDLVKFCDLFEEKKYNLSKYNGLWTVFPPNYYQKEVLEKGYYLLRIEIYKHEAWRGGKREPDFTTLLSLEKVKKDTHIADSIQYTGRNHKIESKEFFEIDLLKDDRKIKVIGNPFLELVEDILREGENILREAHGLPKIGEGWVSEMELFNLVQSFFPDAQNHISPEWLKPQHLDVYVPTEKLAFEYQGQQHYEPVDFFGGQKSFEEIVKRDKRKRLKCKKNGVVLIYWRYDEAINKKVLKIKLKNFDHEKKE